MILLLALAISAPVPKTAVINGDVWQIIEVGRINNNFTLSGYTDCKLKTIELLKSDSDEEKAETLIHEVLHAVTCENGEINNDKWNNDDEAHQGIYFGGRVLTAFIQDNPEVVRYVQEHARKRK